MSIPIRITGDQWKSDMTFSLTASIRLEFLDQNLSVTRLSMRNVVRNIDIGYNNNYVSWTNNGTSYSTIIPSGYYSISDLASYFSALANISFSLTYNSQTDLVTLDVTALNSTVNIGSAFGLLIGFAPNTYANGIYTSTSNPANPVSYVQLLTTNLTDSNPINVSSKTIATFSPKEVPFGSMFVYEPKTPLEYPIIDGGYPVVAVQFVDQNFNSINMDTNSMCLDLVVSKRSKEQSRFFGY